MDKSEMSNALKGMILILLSIFYSYKYVAQRVNMSESVIQSSV